MSTYKTLDIVAALRAMKGLTLEEMVKKLGKQFPNCDEDQLGRAFGIAHEQALEEAAECERESKELDLISQIFEGCPEGVLFGEWVKIKAAKGDPLALSYLRHTQTRAYRVNTTLAEAAYDAHPLFSRERDHIIKWHGEGEGPSTTALIDWFQKNHPQAARQIERSFDDAA